MRYFVIGRADRPRCVLGHSPFVHSHVCRSEGFALTGYDIPGCVEDGAWMLWENSSVAAAVVAAAAVAHPGLKKLFEFHCGIGASGVRGSIRLVFRSTDARILLFFPCVKKSNIKKQSKKIKNM